MQFCSKCGKRNPSDVPLCNYCGFQISNYKPNLVQAKEYEVVQLRHEYCDGTGVDHHSSLFGVKCRTCEGTGKVSIRLENKSLLVQCPICKGSGVDRRNSMRGVECKKCYGTGQTIQRFLSYG